MNDSINLFNIAKKYVTHNKNASSQICPEEITLEMLKTELSGYEFDLTIDLLSTNKTSNEVRNMLWNSYYITMFSGNFGIHEFQNKDNPKCIIPNLKENNNNNIKNDINKVDLTHWFPIKKEIIHEKTKLTKKLKPKTKTKQKLINAYNK